MVEVQDLPNHVPFTVFYVATRPDLKLYHSLVVPPGEQSNLPYTYVSLAYTKTVDGQHSNIWIAQCDKPLWEQPDLEWHTIGDLLVNEDYDAQLICRMKLRRDGTYLRMESKGAPLDRLIEEARNLSPIVCSPSP